MVVSFDARGLRKSSITHLVLDESGERQVVEQVCEELPDVGVSVLSEALVVKAIDLGDLTRLMVSPVQAQAK